MLIWMLALPVMLSSSPWSPPHGAAGRGAAFVLAADGRTAGCRAGPGGAGRTGGSSSATLSRGGGGRPLQPRNLEASVIGADRRGDRDRRLVDRCGDRRRLHRVGGTRRDE